MTKEQAINILIKDSDTNQISDGYHTFGEMYEHRIALFIALCYERAVRAWKSKRHSDGSTIEGWFILGLNSLPGEQITYHLPESKWGEVNFCEELETAPEWDGHTSADVIERLKYLN